MIAWPLSGSLFMAMSCACFGPRHSPCSYSTFNIFGNDAVWAENRTFYLPRAERNLKPWRKLYSNFFANYDKKWKLFSTYFFYAVLQQFQHYILLYVLYFVLPIDLLHINTSILFIPWATLHMDNVFLGCLGSQETLIRRRLKTVTT